MSIKITKTHQHLLCLLLLDVSSGFWGVTGFGVTGEVTGCNIGFVTDCPSVQQTMGNLCLNPHIVGRIFWLSSSFAIWQSSIILHTPIDPSFRLQASPKIKQSINSTWQHMAGSIQIHENMQKKRGFRMWTVKRLPKWSIYLYFPPSSQLGKLILTEIFPSVQKHDI